LVTALVTTVPVEVLAKPRNGAGADGGAGAGAGGAQTASSEGTWAHRRRSPAGRVCPQVMEVRAVTGEGAAELLAWMSSQVAAAVKRRW